MTTFVLTIGYLLASQTEVPKPEQIVLWPKGAPGALGTSSKDIPTMTLYLPARDKRSGTAILVCPGGGYGALALGHEGKEIADWLVERGIAAFVLEYRLGPRYRFPIPLQDAQRGLRLIRARAKEWGLDPSRVGIWGFSAGGHLASTVSTRFDEGKREAEETVERFSSRPDFAILCYPVIRMTGPYAHQGSRRNLLGENPEDKLIASLNNDTQVGKTTPPTFLFHTKADKPVPYQNSQLYYDALVKAGVPARLELYEGGPHGVGLGKKHPEVKGWPNKLESWLRERKLLWTVPMD